MDDFSKQTATHSTGAPSSSQEFVGYIHNVSAVYNEKFFQCQLQGRDESVTRAVCFSPSKRKIFADFQDKKSPIKIKRFKVDTNANTSDLLMGHDVIVEHYPELDFQRSQIQSSTTLLSVKSVRVGQHITVKAKLTNMSKQQKAGDLTLVNCILLDPTASMKMVLWENFINQVENNRTYIFHNVTVRKDKYNETIYLNTAKYGTEIRLTEDFTEILAVPLTQDTTQFVSTTVKGEIMGIVSINSYFSCFKCKKKLEQSTGAAYLECKNCHMKQKLKPASQHWYAQVMVQFSDEKSLELTLFEEPIKQILAIQNQKSQPTLTRDILTNSLLNLPAVNFTYNTTTKVVLKIAQKE